MEDDRGGVDVEVGVLESKETHDDAAGGYRAEGEI